MKLKNGCVLVVEHNKFDETWVDWSIWPKTPKVSTDFPIEFSSFSIEVKMNKSWVPCEETFDIVTRNMWKVLQPLCRKIGMRKNNV